MKKQISKIVKCLVVALGFTIVTNAQDAKSNYSNMTPDQRVEARLNRLKEKLSLTDAQVPQVKNLLVEEEKEHAANPNDQKGNHSKMSAEMSKILTPEQMTKMKEMQAERQKNQGSGTSK